MDYGELAESPSKFTLLMRWLFDNTLLPFMEMIFPCDHPDDPAPGKARYREEVVPGASEQETPEPRES